LYSAGLAALLIPIGLTFAQDQPIPERADRRAILEALLRAAQKKEADAKRDGAKSELQAALDEVEKLRAEMKETETKLNQLRTQLSRQIEAQSAALKAAEEKANALRARMAAGEKPGGAPGQPGARVKYFAVEVDKDGNIKIKEIPAPPSPTGGGFGIIEIDGLKDQLEFHPNFKFKIDGTGEPGRDFRLELVPEGSRKKTDRAQDLEKRIDALAHEIEELRKELKQQPGKGDKKRKKDDDENEVSRIQLRLESIFPGQFGDIEFQLVPDGEGKKGPPRK
jgi:TolA-binding protein